MSTSLYYALIVALIAGIALGVVISPIVSTHTQLVTVTTTTTATRLVTITECNLTPQTITTTVTVAKTITLTVTTTILERVNGNPVMLEVDYLSAGKLVLEALRGDDSVTAYAKGYVRIGSVKAVYEITVLVKTNKTLLQLKQYLRGLPFITLPDTYNVTIQLLARGKLVAYSSFIVKVKDGKGYGESELHWTRRVPFREINTIRIVFSLS